MAGKAPETGRQSLKILMTADAAGGVWQYSVDLVEGLLQHGGQVLIATMGPRPSAEQKGQLRATTRVTLAESDYALEWTTNPWNDVEAAGKWLLELAGSFGADLVHLNGYSHAILPWCKPVVITAHSCVYSWWKAVHKCAPGAEWAEYKRRVTEGLAACDRVIAPSAYMAQAIEEEYGVAREKIQVIHNFSRTARREGATKEDFLLAAGRMWDPAKNLSLLEAIAPELDWEIRIAGSDRGPDGWAEKTRAIRGLGVLPHAQLLQEMERASIFVHPALYEPFGLAVLEAAQRRCCLVLSDIPSLRELWEGAAVFVNPRQPEDWIRELNRVLGDSAERQTMARRAFSRAGKYRNGTALHAYWKVYTSLLGSTPRGSKEAAA